MPKLPEATEEDEDRRKFLIETRRYLGMTYAEMGRFMGLSSAGYRSLELKGYPVRRAYVSALLYLTGQRDVPGNFAVGDAVTKVGGDYQIDGVVVAAFRKLDGQMRYVVEHEPGFLHIYAARNLMPRLAKEEEPVEPIEADPLESEDAI